MANRFEFEFTLSHKSISNLVKNIKSYQVELENSKKHILQALADYTFERVQYYILTTTGNGTYIPTDELANSIAISPIIQDVISIYTNLAYAKFVEFGTGVTGSKNQHPKTNEFNWTYGEKGWYYHASDGNIYYTEGQEAHQFMYKATEDVKANYERIAKQVLRERGLIK